MLWRKVWQVAGFLMPAFFAARWTARFTSQRFSGPPRALRKSTGERPRAASAGRAFTL